MNIEMALAKLKAIQSIDSLLEKLDTQEKVEAKEYEDLLNITSKIAVEDTDANVSVISILAVSMLQGRALSDGYVVDFNEETLFFTVREPGQEQKA